MALLRSGFNSANDILLAPPSKPKIKKRVQIRSPPASPTSPEDVARPGIGRRLSAGRDGSPPPVTTAPREDESYEPVSSSNSSMEQEALENMRRNSGVMAQEPAKPGGGGALLNPFAKTMASSEARAFGLRDSEQGVDEGAQMRPQGGKGRMDVDAFKNMLMTGSATPSPPLGKAPGPEAQGGGVRDGNSSMDASSGTRHSLFDPAVDSLRSPDSPRTSFDHSNSSDEEEDDDENANLVGKGDGQDAAKPTIPRHKHGKVLGERGPQTVSFADFDETIPSPRTPTGENPPFSGRPPLGRSPSDLNKPLPPPPEGHSSPHVTTPAVPEKDEPSVQDEEKEKDTEEQRDQLVQQEAPIVAVETAEAEPPSQAKKPPPPLPASRRQGGHNRTRSGSDLTTNSAQNEDGAELAQKSSNTPRQAPPPPPSRRTQAVSSPSLSPAGELSPDSQPQTQTRAPAPEINSLAPPEGPSQSQRPADASTKAMPPPPAPRRNTSKTGSFTRTPSNASHTSGASATTGGNAPPPPPSRRSKPPPPTGSRDRRTSSQSELVEREPERSGSVGSLQASAFAVGEEGEAGQKDILADIAALQREVDELRAKAGKT